jgi:hypothetical protein
VQRERKLLTALFETAVSVELSFGRLISAIEDDEIDGDHVALGGSAFDSPPAKKERLQAQASAPAGATESTTDATATAPQQSASAEDVLDWLGALGCPELCLAIMMSRHVDGAVLHSLSANEIEDSGCPGPLAQQIHAMVRAAAAATA